MADMVRELDLRAVLCAVIQAKPNASVKDNLALAIAYADGLSGQRRSPATHEQKNGRWQTK